MWESSEITFFESITFSILSLLLLYIIGQSFLWLICKIGKKNDPFYSYDIYQKINYRITFGVSFTLLALMVFSVFNVSFFIKSLLLLTIALGLSTISYATKLRRHVFYIKSLRRPNLRALVCNASILVIIFATLFLSAKLIEGFYGSTNDDGAFHTFTVRVILDNPNALLTHSTIPYAEYINIYPSAIHALSAFFVAILNIPIQKIVIMFSAMLPSLIALSFYSTLNCLFKNKVLSILGTFLSALFTLNFSWGPLAWAGLPLLLSFYISNSSMGLFFTIFEKEKVDSLEAFLVSLIFFLAIQTYPVTLLYTSVWFFLLNVRKLFKKIHRGINFIEFRSSIFQRKNLTLFMAFLIPLMFSIPYIYIVYNHSNPSLQGYPPDVPFDELTANQNFQFELVRQRINFNWLFNIPALSEFFAKFGKILYLAPYSLILILTLHFASIYKASIRRTFPRKVVWNISLIYIFFLSIMCYLTLSTSLQNGFFFWFFNPERVWQHIFIPGVILTSVVLFFVGYCAYVAFNVLSRKDSWREIPKARSAHLACATLLLLLFLTLGFAGVSCFTESKENYNELRLSLNRFNSLQYDDILLMLWIKENISNDAIILVTPGDSGQYLSALSQRKTVYSYDTRLYSRKYQYLVTQLSSDPSNPDVIPLLLEYNVSYVYIGSKALTYPEESPFRAHFNATKFLKAPHFKLTKQIGDAWLFQLTQS